MRYSPSVLLLSLLIIAIPAWGGPIHDAAKDGNLDEVKRLLASNPELLNAVNDRNASALHFACEYGHLELAQYLLSKGPDLAIKDADGDTPLHGAALSNNKDIVEALIAGGADVNARNLRDQTPLHYAAYRQAVEAARVLVAHGADVNAADYESHTPLHAVSYRHNRELMLLLLEHGADIEAKNDYGRTPLLLVARESGSAEAARILIDHGADINAPDKYGSTPLGLAAWRGFRGIVDLLLDKGAALPEDEEEFNNLTMNATVRGLARLFNALVDHGADLTITNEDGGSLLHSACAGGSEELTEILIDRGLDINQQDRYGWTPLHCAAENGRLQAATLLISKGALLNQRTLSGYSPYNIAVEYKRDDLVELLKSSGADTEPPDFPLLEGKYLGQTPPGAEPELFAPDIVASNRFEHGTVTFTPAGDEAYWSSSYPVSDSGYTRARILYSRMENGRWLPPQLAPFSLVEYGDDVPFVAPDGQKLFFISRRPPVPDARAGAERIWVINRLADGWSEPLLIEGGPNDKSIHWQFSIAANGNIYFGSGDAGGFGMGDIYISRLVDNKYLPAENMGNVINGETDEGSPFIAPDESYLIFTGLGRPENNGGPDIYISFRNKDGRWTAPQNMGEPVNTPSSEICPMVTPDGKYFLFNSFKNGNADNYWIDADFINRFRPEEE